MPQPQNRNVLGQRQKEERQKRIIIIGTIVVLVAVLGLVAYGIFDLKVLQPRKNVIKVEDRTVNVTEYKQRVRYRRFQMINQAVQLVQFSQSMGSNAQAMGYFQQQLVQIAQQLNQPNTVGEQVNQALVDELIILEEAEKMGISLSDEEFEKELQGVFGYYPDGTPTPTATLDILPTSTLSPQQLTLVPDTPTPGGEEGGDQTALTPTPTTDPGDAQSGDPTATPMIRPTEYTQEQFETNYQEALTNLKEQANLEEETFRSLVRRFLIRERVQEEVTSDVERTQEQVWARHILVNNEETAQEVLTKLEEGESFAELAEEYSTDPSNNTRGGDLGWFGRGSMVPAFEDAAFSLDVGGVSEPVETQFGWHIIQVLGHEERSIPIDTYQQMVQQEFQSWLAEKREEYDTEIADDWQRYVPSEPNLPAQIQQIISLSQQQNQQPGQIQPGAVTPNP